MINVQELKKSNNAMHTQRLNIKKRTKIKT